MFDYLVEQLQRRQIKKKCVGLPSNALSKHLQGDVWSKTEAQSRVRRDISTWDLIAF